jgi:serine O-acetyltransferase
MNDQANQLHESPLPLWRSLHADALAHVPPEKRASLRASPTTVLMRQLITSSGLRCTLVYRLSHTLRARVPLLGTIASKLLFWFGRHWYGISIAGTARIGSGLVLPHPQGIVIGAEVRIGERAWIYQNVTIGGAPGKTGMPSLGDDARIFAGAVIVGPLRIGNEVWIGANAVASGDVPDRHIVRAGCSEPSPRRDVFASAEAP